ncbi:dihydrolipoamide acetyltransferase family protein [Allosalinactinospora lopnorensis]|uniref:dihydrolipoamide acetyltransferase family protein n=1 Tax=Allosalinactinospora lopnorensis TaxID=1352348 RepID=UPI000623F3C3|nr:dihydrolipoamide acetyltransferase family protein [Allosalinactinospora lopnorensis]
MAELLRMPEVAAASTDAILSSWNVVEGGGFAENDAIAVIETDKAEVEITAEADGVLLTALCSEGAEVPVGGPIAVLGSADEKAGDLDALFAELGVAGLAETATARREVPDPPAAGTAARGAEPAPRATDGAADDRGVRIFISPLARRMARDVGLAIETITGTGPGARIVRRDVEAAIAAQTKGTEQDGEPAEPAEAATTTSAPSGAYEEVPHSRMRTAIAARLAESKRTAPHFYVRARCRADALLELRERINAASPVRVSVNDMLVKAVAKAHTLVPEMNVAWDSEAVRRFTAVDISVAVTTDNGLVTPVLRGVEAMPVSAVATRVRDYTDKAGSGGLRQSDLEGGSITVSNLGMFGAEEFAAIINPPQAAVLAVGALQEEALVIDGAVEVATTVHLVLSADHRPVDGVLAARWITTLKAVIEDPFQILV